MNAFLKISAASILWAGAIAPALAADPAPAQVATASTNCVPGITAAIPGVCERAGFHWQYTTASMGHNNYYRPVWMLLPDK